MPGLAVSYHCREMSAVLTGKGLSAGHGDRILFSGVDLVVSPGEVTGLVGANGAGKSTLLRMLAGLGAEAAEGGSVSLNPPTATVGYLSQEPERRAGETVLGFIARRTGVSAAQQDLDAATEALAGGADDADDAYSGALDRWLNLGGADLEERTLKVAAGLGLAVRLDQAMTALSGGQAARPTSPRCCCPATTCSCSTSRPTTSTSTGSPCLRTS